MNYTQDVVKRRLDKNPNDSNIEKSNKLKVIFYNMPFF